METGEIIKKVRKIEIKTRGLSQNIFAGQYHSAFKGRGMAFSEVLTLIFVQQKHLVTEAPITVAPRRSGKSTINTITSLDTMLQIINIVMVFNPMRIFLPLGGAMIVFGSPTRQGTRTARQAVR